MTLTDLVLRELGLSPTTHQCDEIGPVEHLSRSNASIEVTGDFQLAGLRREDTEACIKAHGEATRILVEGDCKRHWSRGLVNSRSRIHLRRILDQRAWRLIAITTVRIIATVVEAQSATTVSVTLILHVVQLHLLRGRHASFEGICDNTSRNGHNARWLVAVVTRGRIICGYANPFAVVLTCQDQAPFSNPNFLNLQRSC